MDIVELRPEQPCLVMRYEHNLWYLMAHEANKFPVRIVIGTDELEAALKAVNPAVTAMIVSMDYHVSGGDRLGIRLAGGELSSVQCEAVCRRLEESPQVYHLIAA